MRFFSDNAARIHPKVMEAIVGADEMDSPYDGDRWSKALDERLSDLFGTDVEVLWVPTGTAANCLALAALCPPYGGVVCHRDSHIQNDEGGAPEFYTHGAKLMLADGEGAKLTPDTIRTVIDAIANDVHRVQPHAISITNATEYGRVYNPDEVAAIGALAKERKLGFHMDGARFANAVARLGCTPAALTWQAGVDALSFGFVKNGAMSAEALVFFKPGLADATRRRRKRAGLLMSKGRYLAAQVLAMVENDLWIANGALANACAERLAEAAGDRLIHAVEANEVFLRATPDETAKLRAQGFDFYDWAEGEIRLVTAWDTDAGAVGRLADAIAALNKSTT
ncbi:threonine aldolase family protein [Sphingomonas sanguinis]|jgi:threonine aldolase|uniref:Low specificity L-threonine aldolase n=1 Tax=Sphingomonas sanguinis TaxID=33051 RepID=A0A7Y7QYY1_9SPHN|nr:beta-eliminating lyase-related protein [Sphingomonas sanguinis]MBZ6383939.1 low specificity L-threonine aldolase [Sphingomonas sanguinis]NNG50671.1 low specificity L-threonine aldolase [Sphingomonas sanguinis]NNG55429.1 low specificity L-threonine aldolase [Sphingomonas sanguinis]NVP33230.1 low specificity L-threonine aldolase [Sphingomonas sanguinis]